MKKFLSDIMVMVLALSIMLSFSGCFKSNPFLGNWISEYNLVEVFNNGLGNDEAANYLKLDEFELAVRYTFNDDGTYKVEPIISECNEEISEAKDKIRKGMEAYLLAEAEKQGIGDMTVEEILSYSNTTMDAMMEGIFKEADFEGIVESLNAEGNYAINENKLVTTDSLSKDISEGTYEFYEVIDDDEIKLTIPDDADENLIEVYPIILERD